MPPNVPSRADLRVRVRTAVSSRKVSRRDVHHVRLSVFAARAARSHVNGFTGAHSNANYGTGARSHSNADHGTGARSHSDVDHGTGAQPTCEDAPSQRAGQGTPTVKAVPWSLAIDLLVSCTW